MYTHSRALTHSHVYTHPQRCPRYLYTHQHSYTHSLTCLAHTLTHSNTHTHTAHPDAPTLSHTLGPQRVRTGLGRRGDFWAGSMTGSAKGWVSSSLDRAGSPKRRGAAVGLCGARPVNGVGAAHASPRPASGQASLHSGIVSGALGPLPGRAEPGTGPNSPPLPSRALSL